MSVDILSSSVTIFVPHSTVFRQHWKHSETYRDRVVDSRIPRLISRRRNRLGRLEVQDRGFLYRGTLTGFKKKQKVDERRNGKLANRYVECLNCWIHFRLNCEDPLCCLNRGDPLSVS